MNTSTLDKPVLWSYSEAAQVLGLPGVNGRKVVSALVKALKLQPKPMANGKAKGLDRSDLGQLAVTLRVDLAAQPTALPSD